MRRKRSNNEDRQKNEKKKDEKFEANAKNLCELLSKKLKKKFKTKGKKYSTREKSKDLKNYKNSKKSKVIRKITLNTASIGKCSSTHLESSLLIMSCQSRIAGTTNNWTIVEAMVPDFFPFTIIKMLSILPMSSVRVALARTARMGQLFLRAILLPILRVTR